MKPLKIVIVGLGLIGGSMAKALKQNTSHQVLGMDQDDEARRHPHQHRPGRAHWRGRPAGRLFLRGH